MEISACLIVIIILVALGYGFIIMKSHLPVCVLHFAEGDAVYMKMTIIVFGLVRARKEIACV